MVSVQPAVLVATSVTQFIQETGEALYAAIILCYAQGLSMLHHASIELKMEIPLIDVVKIWRGGCIIRASLLESFYRAFSQHSALTSILQDDAIAAIIRKTIPALRKVTVAALQAGIPAPALSSALGFFDAYTCERLPTNLLQAQRDYFGAHSYERIDREGKFHTEWVGNG